MKLMILLVTILACVAMAAGSEMLLTFTKTAPVVNGSTPGTFQLFTAPIYGIGDDGSVSDGMTTLFRINTATGEVWRLGPHPVQSADGKTRITWAFRREYEAEEKWEKSK